VVELWRLQLFGGVFVQVDSIALHRCALTQTKRHRKPTGVIDVGEFVHVNRFFFTVANLEDWADADEAKADNPVLSTARSPLGPPPLQGQAPTPRGGGSAAETAARRPLAAEACADDGGDGGGGGGRGGGSEGQAEEGSGGSAGEVERAAQCARNQRSSGLF
jgi:hypothetical protein